MKIVCKFGGTSLACKENIRRCIEIIKENPKRKYIVVSAPGKSNISKEKVTDLLFSCYKSRFDEKKFEKSFNQIKNIYLEIALVANNFPIKQELEKIYNEIKSSEANLDYVLSRGEYLNAKIVAHALGFIFLDAVKFVRFNKGELDLSATLACAKEYVDLQGVVIPGFYGKDEQGHIKTFSRGGSDITGSVVARAFNCDLYENWTDVDGIHVCDPKIISNSKRVSQISFRELREMSYMGASVLHAETLLPLQEYPIPIHLKSSFCPTLDGTEILKKRTELSEKETITCITGKNDYSNIQSNVRQTAWFRKKSNRSF